MSAADAGHVCMLLPDTYPPDVRVEKEVHALREGGYEVTLLCLGGPDQPARERVGGASVVRLETRSTRDRFAAVADAAAYTATFRRPRWGAALSDLLAERDVDALHVHDLPLVRTATAVGREAGVSVVADLHENYPEAVRQWRTAHPSAREDPLNALQRAAQPVSRLKRAERRAVRDADHVLTVAAEARRHYLDDCALLPERVTVVGNTVDLDAFDPDAEPVAPTDRVTATYVGGFGPHRGLETAVRAVAALDVDTSPEADEADVELRLVGDGPTMGALRGLVADLDVEDRVTFAGRVPMAEVPGHVAASDLCLVPHASTPHTNTTLPHKLFQYMAMRKPVVVSDLPPLERVLDATDAGRTFAAGDADALADLLRELAADPDERERLGANGRAAVESQYNWSVDAARLRRVYGHLLG